MAIAKISACYHLHDVLDDLVVSLCKFTTLLNPLYIEDSVIAFANDTKARMATTAVFTIANSYGDYIRSGWRNILDCILSLQKLRLLPAYLASDVANDLESSSDLERNRPTSSLSTSQTPSVETLKKSSSLMSRFSQLLSFDMDEPRSQPTEEEAAAHELSLQTVQNCHIDSIFTESKFLQADSLLHLLRSLILAAGQIRKGNYDLEDEDSAVFSLELLIAITVNNRDRIVLLWKDVYVHISNIVQSTVIPCMLVEKAVFGLLRICQRLLPYKENLTDELLKSLQLILKLDARVADAYCEPITQEVMRLVKANATHIRSHIGWRAIISLLSITARHPEASETGFETLAFIMSHNVHLMPANYVLCVDAGGEFAESLVGHLDRSICAIDLMADSIVCLVRWSHETKETVEEEAAVKLCQNIGEMWLRLVLGLKKLCFDRRIEVRNHALLMLQRCLIEAEGICLSDALWMQCFNSVIFPLLDDLLKIVQENSPNVYRNMEATVVIAMKLLSKVFLQFLHALLQLPSFCKLWVGVLNRFEACMTMQFRGRQSEKIHELGLELLKNMLLVMKSSGVLLHDGSTGADSLWELTWLYVKNIDASLQSEVFPRNELEQPQTKTMKTSRNPGQDGAVLVQSGDTLA